MSGFKDFLLKTNALALAVGVILGIALGTVVNSLVNDVIMPPIGYALGGLDFSQLKIVLKAATSPTATDEVAVRYGALISSIISFGIIAFVVYMISKGFMRPAAEPPAPPTKVCPYCKETVAAEATKCKACTSAI